VPAGIRPPDGIPVDRLSRLQETDWAQFSASLQEQPPHKRAEYLAYAVECEDPILGAFLLAALTAMEEEREQIWGKLGSLTPPRLDGAALGLCLKRSDLPSLLTWQFLLALERVFPDSRVERRAQVLAAKTLVAERPDPVVVRLVLTRDPKRQSALLHSLVTQNGRSLHLVIAASGVSNELLRELVTPLLFDATVEEARRAEILRYLPEDTFRQDEVPDLIAASEAAGTAELHLQFLRQTAFVAPDRAIACARNRLLGGGTPFEAADVELILWVSGSRAPLLLRDLLQEANRELLDWTVAREVRGYGKDSGENADLALLLLKSTSPRVLVATLVWISEGEFAYRIHGVLVDLKTSGVWTGTEVERELEKSIETSRRQ